MYFSPFITPLGPGLVTASHVGIRQVTLPSPSLTAAIASSDPSGFRPNILTVHAAVLLASYFRGGKPDFMDLVPDLQFLSPFHAAVLLLIRSIPYGETLSYGQVAAMAGKPRAARATGGAMAANPLPVIIPCHRVIGRDGKLTGFSGAGGLTMKKYLLELECADLKGKNLF